MADRVFCVRSTLYGRDNMLIKAARIIESFGGTQAFAGKGSRVLIKPNILMARRPEMATTTHPDLIFAVAKIFVGAGFDVTIADSPGGPYNKAAMQKAYNDCGIRQASELAGAKLNLDFSHGEVLFSGIRSRRFEIITPVLDADIIINISKMKSHMFMHFTGAVKNHFGVLPGLNKATYHSALPEKSDFAAMLVDLCCAVNADLHIMDGICGMDGRGPSGGRVRECGVLLASKNPFALDHAAMRFCGIEPGSAPVHAQAVKAGIDVSFELEGDKLTPLSEPFDMPMGTKTGLADLVAKYTPGFLRKLFLNRSLSPCPVITNRCVGCGDCARACPEQAIEIENRQAYIDMNRCIRCYCCHELCPIKAIDL